ncbi:hypothetical protein K466DRAFT_592237 [Polyporus arcularius HHB13444]|uniref:Uncharacterized protein n=1 Tax=Polyporus arcularius HHB13444 TaxID=1314778 RepID=A0A5C3NQZ1_9APHY|nr:hypothetical protein K466DRAFT_592237 [Polyporus arcularius HHB13444]
MASFRCSPLYKYVPPSTAAVACASLIPTAVRRRTTLSATTRTKCPPSLVASTPNNAPSTRTGRTSQAICVSPARLLSSQPALANTIRPGIHAHPAVVSLSYAPVLV